MNGPVLGYDIGAHKTDAHPIHHSLNAFQGGIQNTTAAGIKTQIA